MSSALSSFSIIAAPGSFHIRTGRHTMIDPNGLFIAYGPDGKEIQVNDSHQCPHCGRHKRYTEGMSEHYFCQKCRRIVCDNPICVKYCVPVERQIENLERGRDRLWTPATASVAIDVGALGG